MSDKLTVETAKNDCEECHFNRGHDGCGADEQSKSECVERFNQGDNTIYKLEIEE